MLKALTVAALVSTLPLTAAVAAPDQHRLPTIQLVDMRHGHDRHHGGGHHGFTPGRHYGKAPHGWHGYRARPGDWRTRGCVVVGPLWYCP